MNEFHYFPSVVYREERPEWVEPVLRRSEPFYEAIRQYHKEQGVSQRGIQTEHLGNDPELCFLEEYFKQTSIEILKSQGYFTEQYTFKTSAMWAHEIVEGGWYESHVHPNTHITAFYFLQAPIGGSYPIFSDPRTSKSTNDLFLNQDENIYVGTNKIYFNNIVPGTFLFVNSYVPHQFSQHFAKETLKFIHYNLTAIENHLWT